MSSGKPRPPASRTRWGLAVALALIAAPVAASSAGAATHHRRPPPPVVAVGQPAPGSLTSATALACADARHCWAVGLSPTGVAIDATFDGGATWRSEAPPAGLTVLAGVSCPARSNCLAVGAAGDAGAVAVTDDGGRTWGLGQDPSGAIALSALSCPAKDRCLALATDGSAWWAALSVDQGESWTREGDLPAGMVPASLACPGPTRCIAVGSTPSTPGRAAGAVALSTDGGATWAPVTLPTGVGILRAVACAAATCIAAGTPSTATTGLVAAPGQLVTSANGGASWTIVPRNLPDDAYGVACPEATVCLVVGTDWVGKDPPRPTGAILATLDGGRSWRAARLRYVPVGVAAVACPVVDRCLAAGGNVLVTVTLPVHPPPAPAPRAGIAGAH